MITAGWHYLHGDSKVDIGSVSNTVSIVSDSDGDEVNRYPTGLSWSSVLEAVTACIAVTVTQLVHSSWNHLQLFILYLCKFKFI